MTRGFKRVRPLEGGLDAWLDAGLDVEDEEELLIAVRRPSTSIRIAEP
jgi:3-mercaptopyruvate sulfurtransferase SseA